MEEQRENVRSLLLTLLLLVAPLPLGDLVDEDVFVGTEVELHLPNGQVWGQSEWDNLVEFGYIPLRLMTPSELVALSLIHI